MYCSIGSKCIGDSEHIKLIDSSYSAQFLLQPVTLPNNYYSYDYSKINSSSYS